jgi:cellulose synthase/poly-beta-1,6-N-acetylglucosamine synthase-like glycosyltransferase
MAVWIRQRSRWLKGYMQTWLVHMRNPFRLLMDLKPKGFWGFQAMVFGTFFLPLVNPLLWLLLILWFATKAAWISQLFPGAIYYGSLFLLIVGNFFFIYTSAVGIYWVINDISRREGLPNGRPLPFSYEILKYALIIPLYWVLMSVASFKALWQLVSKPKYWEKTAHGLNGDKYDSVGDINQAKKRETG